MTDSPNRRWQFRLASLFGVMLVVALLANVARLGHYDIALFLGGAILGSFAARRFFVAIVGGAFGGTAVALLFLCWAVFFNARPPTPGAVDVSNVPGMIPFAFAGVAASTLAIGAIVGGFVWVIKTLWQLNSRHR